MKKYTPIILFASIILFATSCEKFLSELPTKGTSQPISHISQLEALFNGGAYLRVQSGNMQTAATDHYEIPLWLFNWSSTTPPATPAYIAHFASVTRYFFYFWDVDEIAKQSSDAAWSSAYTRIYSCNLILENIDNVEGDELRKRELKAEAHFTRAYQMFELVNLYCLPYHPDNFNEPGLSRKASTDPTEDLTRMTLKETYDFILADIAEGLKISKVAPTNRWRFDNKATMNAFLSRVYLFMREYDKAVETATFALNNLGVARLKDYATIQGGAFRAFTNPPDTIFWSEMEYYGDAALMQWEEFFFTSYNYNGNWLLSSQSLLNLYDKEHDYRFKWFWFDESRISNYLGTEGRPLYSYSPWVSRQHMIYGPTVQEVMLNKAEALVRKSSPDFAGAMALVNQLRNNRIAPNANRTVTATGFEQTLLSVLDERRRELPYAFRWFDIRRFAWNDTPIDDVVITRNFYEIINNQVDRTKPKTYTLPLRSRKYAFPINTIEVGNTQGQFQQNTY